MNQQEQPQTRRDIEARIIATAWKDDAYKQELLTNPKAVIEREFEAQLPAEVNVQVIEENPTSLCFVLPMRPEIPGQELDESELEAIAGGGRWGKSWTPEMVKDSIKVSIAGSLVALTVGVTK